MVGFPVTMKMDDWEQACEFCYEGKLDKTYEVGADKSLALPVRKQTTATKLGIYSTYSRRSSIHFLARCSCFCKPLKKKSEICLSNKVSAATIISASDEKWLLSIAFSVQGTGGSQTGPYPENRVGDQDMGSPGRPVLLGCKCPMSRSIILQYQDPLCDPETGFLQNVLQMHQKR